LNWEGCGKVGAVALDGRKAEHGHLHTTLLPKSSHGSASCTGDLPLINQ
jgi:hypothetical protein